MYLSLYDAGGTNWVRIVIRFCQYNEEAGISIYALICDHLVIPTAALLVLGVFAINLFSFEAAAEKATNMGVFAHMVLFLDRPKASFFKAGRFLKLIPVLPVDLWPRQQRSPNQHHGKASWKGMGGDYALQDISSKHSCPPADHSALDKLLDTPRGLNWADELNDSDVESIFSEHQI